MFKDWLKVGLVLCLVGLTSCQMPQPLSERNQDSATGGKPPAEPPSQPAPPTQPAPPGQPSQAYTLQTNTSNGILQSFIDSSSSLVVFVKPVDTSFSVNDVVLAFQLMRDDGSGTFLSWDGTFGYGSGQHPNKSWFSSDPGGQKAIEFPLGHFSPSLLDPATWNQGFTKLRILTSVKYLNMSANGNNRQVDVPLLVDAGHYYWTLFFVNPHFVPALPGDLPRGQWQLWTELTATYSGGPGVVVGERQTAVPEQPDPEDELLVFSDGPIYRPANPPLEHWVIKLDRNGDQVADYEWVIPEFAVSGNNINVLFDCSADPATGQPIVSEL